MNKALIHLVDDDAAVRKSLMFLLRASGFSVEAFNSATDFLDRGVTCGGDCIITDIRMPVINGLQLIRKLRSTGVTLPIIVITGHGDIPIAVEAMKAGACDFLEKPFANEAFLRAIEGALAARSPQASDDAQRHEISTRLQALTEREREVMRGVVSGYSNKEVARNLGISPRTVDIYRANVMTKMRAETLPELVRLAIASKFLVI